MMINGYEVYTRKQLIEDQAYFLAPAQACAVFNVDADGEIVIKGGIVYKNEFICGCCGQAIPFTSKCICKLFVYEDWADVSDEITGEPADDLKIETE